MLSPHPLPSSQFLGPRQVAPQPRQVAAAILSPRPPPVAAVLRSPGVSNLSPPEVPTSLYEVLGVPASASDREIKAAYRGLALKCHPDVGASAEEFMRVQSAYCTLSDPDKRADYDRQLTASSAAAASLGRRHRSTYSRTTSFPGNRRRTWETDQCW
ncbi:hypothetical protein C4D60_Mb05t06560 [Musa balbisiana]|uniref:J domain-containing protein n=1 Tax=Musa balbisiana TaxID=52838 RepID=A0A4V4H7Z3_MUSBA|nr:hypothetical protein C4D60_Mb05t06560 [Musa balbisiana]